MLGEEQKELYKPHPHAVMSLLPRADNLAPSTWVPYFAPHQERDLGSFFHGNKIQPFLSKRGRQHRKKVYAHFHERSSEHLRHGAPSISLEPAVGTITWTFNLTFNICSGDCPCTTRKNHLYEQILKGSCRIPDPQEITLILTFVSALFLTKYVLNTFQVEAGRCLLFETRWLE